VLLSRLRIGLRDRLMKSALGLSDAPSQWSENGPVI
jgi:hypothetical protein